MTLDNTFDWEISFNYARKTGLSEMVVSYIWYVFYKDLSLGVYGSVITLSKGK